jgi:HK97 gp10 family phage protein
VIVLGQTAFEQTENTKFKLTITDNTEKMAEEIQKKIEATLFALGEFLVSEAKQNAPVDLGQLRASINYDVEANQNKVKYGTNVEYAPYVEFGTGLYAENGEGRKTPWTYEKNGQFYTTEGQKPQPYLRPAALENIEKIKRIAEYYLNQVKV